MDSNGDLIGAGFSQKGNGPRRALVAKMNGVDGSIEWEYTTPEAPVSVELKSVTVDTRDNVFAAGVDNDLPTVIKVNGMTGELMWSYTGTAQSPAVFSDIAIDDDTDHVVAVGFTEGRLVLACSLWCVLVKDLSSYHPVYATWSVHARNKQRS